MKCFWRRTVSIIICIAAGGLLAAFAPFFPQIFNTEADIQRLATSLILLQGLFMPLYAFANAEYFILRSGGKTFITFLFDSCFVWVISIPAAWLLVHLTSLPFLTVFICVNLFDLIKCAIGLIMVKKGIWVNNLTQ